MPEIRGNEWKYVKDCLDTNWVSSVGSYVDQFEKMTAEYVGAKHAIATVNGTSALHIAMLLAGVKAEDEVLVSTLTFIAPVNAVRYIRELSTHKPIVSSMTGSSPLWNPKGSEGYVQNAPAPVVPIAPAPPESEQDVPSLLEIGRRAAMQAEREAIERVLAQTRWNRRQAAKILKISYKALLNKLKIIEEQNHAAQSKQHSA